MRSAAEHPPQDSLILGFSTKGALRLKALILGAAGFVGPYLLRYLTEDLGWQVYATKLAQESFAAEQAAGIYDLDLLNADAVCTLLHSLQPDCVFHLAAQSSVALSWKQPQLTADINIKGTIHLLEAIRSAPNPPKLLLVGSGEEYGHLRNGACPVSEEEPLHPGNIYAATKVCAEQIAMIYQRAYGLWITAVRAFNHIGPGQAAQFVVSDFCKQTAAIEYGEQEPVIRTGNVSAKRDFTDVRDIVRAYGLIMTKGVSGRIYNVGSQKAIAISEVLEQIRALSGVAYTIRTDPAKLRPVDIPIIEADITKLQQDTGWSPVIPLQQTLKDTLAYWRAYYAVQQDIKENKL